MKLKIQEDLEFEQLEQMINSHEDEVSIHSKETLGCNIIPELNKQVVTLNYFSNYFKRNV